MQNLTVLNTNSDLNTYTPDVISEGAKKLILSSRAQNSKLAYKKQVSYFCMWCKTEGINFAVNYSDTDITVTGLDDLKPTHIANYVSYLEGNGKIACDFGGMPIHEFDEEDEMNKYFKRVKANRKA